MKTRGDYLNYIRQIFPNCVLFATGQLNQVLSKKKFTEELLDNESIVTPDIESWLYTWIQSEKVVIENALYKHTRKGILCRVLLKSYYAPDSKYFISYYWSDINGIFQSNRIINVNRPDEPLILPQPMCLLAQEFNETFTFYKKL